MIDRVFFHAHRLRFSNKDTLSKTFAETIFSAGRLLSIAPALWADITRKGPLYLQGDHTGVMYKDIKLRPIMK